MNRTTTRTLALLAGAMLPTACLSATALGQSGAMTHSDTETTESAPTIDPKAEEVWDRYLKKTLGDAAEDRSEIESIVQEGTMEMRAQGMSMKLKLVMVPGTGVRMTMNIPQMGSFEQGMYEGTVWSNNMMQGPRILEGAQAAQFREQSDIFSDLEWDKYYDSITYEGTETTEMLDGSKVETHVLKLDPKDTDQTQKQYFSVDSGLLVKSQMMVAVDGQGEVPATNYVSDYRELGGMMMAYKTVTKLGPQEQVITFDSVELNADVDESEIEPPQEIKDMMDG